jgi:hypothetical protein
VSAFGLDAIFGTLASDRDEVAIEIGLRQQYPWRYVGLWSGRPKAMQQPAPKKWEGK